MMHSIDGHFTAAPRIPDSRAIFPEGVISLILLAGSVALVGLSVDRSDIGPLAVSMVLIVVVSVAVGALLAKSRLDDATAHILMTLCGVAVVTVLVLAAASSLAPDIRNRPQVLWRIALDWYFRRPVLPEAASYLVTILVGTTVWITGYLSAWLLFRRGWALLALTLPGLLLVLGLSTTEHPREELLVAYAGLGVVLVARIHLAERQRVWRRQGIQGPVGMAWRVLLIGTAISLIATSVAWQLQDTFSHQLVQRALDELTLKIDSAQHRASSMVDQITGGSDVATEGSYAAFGESFEISGPPRLTDDPVVNVYSDTSPYLTAQRYDWYSGRGWSSTVDDTFTPEGTDGRRYAPEMTFAAGQDVPLSDDVTAGRVSSIVEIEPLEPSDGRMLTVDAYQASSVPSSVRLSWLQLDGVVYRVQDGSMANVPRDVRRMVQMLRAANLTGGMTDFGPTASSPTMRVAIEAERLYLERRFLSVTWTADDEGSLQSVTVTGQTPIYDDIEAVFFDDASEGSVRYSVLSRPSTASADDLRSAGTDYPNWVMQRYLQLPETVTPRTVALARQIVAGEANPYDRARAIELYLRQTIVYDESVTAPPDGFDVTDYVLFERQRGYCEYSATAMTVMLRAVGIPARVVVGYAPGSYDATVGGFVYKQTNAHAWTEVFVPEYGWIPFEPTSSRSLRDQMEQTGDQSDQVELVLPTIAPPPTEAMPAVISSPEAIAADADEAPPPTMVETGGSQWQGWLRSLLVVGMALAGVLVIGGVMWVAPLRGLALPASLYRRVRRIGRWLGVQPHPAETPGEYARAFVDRAPRAESEIWQIVEYYQAETYGPGPCDQHGMRSAQFAWESIRRQLPRLLIWRR